jgi:hypothetical protein
MNKRPGVAPGPLLESFVLVGQDEQVLPYSGNVDLGGSTVKVVVKVV